MKKNESLEKASFLFWERNPYEQRTRARVPNVVRTRNAAVSGCRSAADNANGTAPRSKNIFVGYLILEMPADSQSEKGKNYISDMLHCVKLDSVVMPCTAVSFHVLTLTGWNHVVLRDCNVTKSNLHY